MIKLKKKKVYKIKKLLWLYRQQFFLFPSIIIVATRKKNIIMASFVFSVFRKWKYILCELFNMGGGCKEWIFWWSIKLLHNPSLSYVIESSYFIQDRSTYLMVSGEPRLNFIDSHNFRVLGQGLFYFGPFGFDSVFCVASTFLISFA